MKHALKLLVCAAMLCLCFVFAAPRASAADVVASGTCGAEGDNLTWTVDSEGTLTISGEGAMADYTEHSSSPFSPWSEHYIYFDTVIISHGVTSIGAYAFFEIPFADITTPDTLTSIGEYAFCHCGDVSSITIPDSVAHIGSGAFSGCYALSEITLPNNITAIHDYTFNNCEYLKEITLPNSVTFIGKSAFSGCESLVNLTVPEAVSFIGAYAFWRCTSLSNIVIPQKVTSIGDHAFDGCDSLTEIAIPANVTSIGSSVFDGCDSLVRITVDKNNTRYSDIDGVLYDDAESILIRCPMASHLTEITVLEGTASIASFAFNGCDSLNTVVLPDSLTSIDRYAFIDCSALTAITIPSGVTSIGKHAFRSCSLLKSVTFKGNAPTIGNYAFSQMTATAYYPADNETWTEDVLQDYGGEITWVPYTSEMIYHTRFSLEDIPNNEFDLNITVTRLGDSSNDVAMIALYTPEGQFIEATTHTLTGDTVQTISLSRDNTDGGIDSVKVFILDSLANPIPLASAAGI